MRFQAAPFILRQTTSNEPVSTMKETAAVAASAAMESPPLESNTMLAIAFSFAGGVSGSPVARIGCVFPPCASCDEGGDCCACANDALADAGELGGEGLVAFLLLLDGMEVVLLLLFLPGRLADDCPAIEWTMASLKPYSPENSLLPAALQGTANVYWNVVLMAGGRVSHLMCPEWLMLPVPGDVIAHSAGGDSSIA